MDMSLKSKLRRAWRGKTVLPFLISLMGTLNRMAKAKHMYETYPETWEDFLHWKRDMVNLYQDKKRAIAYYTETNQPEMIKNIADPIAH